MPCCNNVCIVQPCMHNICQVMPLVPSISSPIKWEGAIANSYLVSLQKKKFLYEPPVMVYSLVKVLHTH